MGSAVSGALAGGIADPSFINAIGNSNFTSTGALTGSTTTTSASYVDMATGSSMTFSKLHADTVLLVWMRKNWFATSANTVASFGVGVNGADYDTSGPATTEASSWQPDSGFVRITGLPAGTYTIQGRWKRVSGAGTLSSGSWFSMLAMEAQ